MTVPSNATWEAPGPGSWLRDPSHSSPGPSPLYRRIVAEHTAPTYRQVFKEFGGAIDTLDLRFVNGALYRRVVPLIGADKDKGKVPPNPVLWLASRLHPELRRRERTATRVMKEKTFLTDIVHWTGTERFEWIEVNRELQSIDPSSLDDGALAAHLRHLAARLIEGWRRHHQLHANDLGPIGDLLAHSKQWGLDPTAVMGLLQGSSPATVEAARFGRAIAEALRSAGVDPASVTDVEQIRAVPSAAAPLEEYLDLYGWRLISDYDIEGLTLNELPAAVCAVVRQAATGTGDTGSTTAEATSPPAAAQLAAQSATRTAESARFAAESALRAAESATPTAQLAAQSATRTAESARFAAESALRAAAGEPELFDDLLADARAAYGIRDDNGPLTWAWPMGLTRRAYLEAGRRLADSGALKQADHVFDLDIDELATLLDGKRGPSANDIADRAELRAWERTLSPPHTLGPIAAEPDLAPLPPGLRRLMNVILAAIIMLEPDPDREEVTLAGLGIGDATYRGTARVAHDAAEAVAAMEPGDVLVAAWTAPSFNAVFAIAGGVVIQEGGLLCHAAVMARELGIPAVIGCQAAMSEIATGDQIEIDPKAGAVRILSRA